MGERFKEGRGRQAFEKSLLDTVPTTFVNATPMGLQLPPRPDSRDRDNIRV
jgi:hypothetical protein